MSRAGEQERIVVDRRRTGGGAARHQPASGQVRRRNRRHRRRAVPALSAAAALQEVSYRAAAAGQAVSAAGKLLARLECRHAARRRGHRHRPSQQDRHARRRPRARLPRPRAGDRHARGRVAVARHATLENVFSLRAIADVHRLRPALDAAERVVIVGGGYIGLEVAAVLRGEGRAVTVVEAEDRVLKRVTAPAVSDFFDTLHREHGVDIRLGARLAANRRRGARDRRRAGRWQDAGRRRRPARHRRARQ